MTGLMNLELSSTSVHGKIPSKLGLIKYLLYIRMGETRIHGPIPSKLENTQQIKYFSIKSSEPNTQFYTFVGTSPVVVGFLYIVRLMLKGFTTYLSSYQVYFPCRIPPMSLHDISNPAPPSSYLNGYYI